MAQKNLREESIGNSMKFLFVGDTHITNLKPKRRKDTNYLATVLDKLEQIEKIGKEYHCDYAIQVGDFFDSWAVGRDVVSEVIAFLKKSKLRWLCIYGQHDIYGHSAKSFSYSSLRILKAADLVTILGSKPVESPDRENPKIWSMHVYGCSFGEEVPKVKEKGAYNILVVHQMISDYPLFPGHDYIHPAAFLRRNPEFNLVVCGDYHYRFASRLGDRICINPGAVIRLEKSDIDHKPAVIVFDTIANSFEIVELKVAPDIFDLTPDVLIKKEQNTTLTQFLDNLKKKKEIRIGWREILFKLIEKEGNDSIKIIVDDCLKEVG